MRAPPPRLATHGAYPEPAGTEFLVLASVGGTLRVSKHRCYSRLRTGVSPCEVVTQAGAVLRVGRSARVSWMRRYRGVGAVAQFYRPY